MQKKFALVTGANKGLGLEVSRQLARRGIVVFLGCRDRERGVEAEKMLQREDLDCYYLPLDVTSFAGVGEAVRQVDSRCDGVDILINNAGIMLDRSDTIATISPENLLQTLHTNTAGALAVAQACLPSMRRKKYGRIVNVSSSLGSFEDIQLEAEKTSAMPGYRISKLALNSITLMLARELKGTNILVNSVCPGWVRTDMGGPDAPGSVEQGADSIAWLALLEEGGPSGGFFLGRDARPW